MKNKPLLTQAYLKTRLHYDPLTGFFTWLSHPKTPELIGKRAEQIIYQQGRRYAYARITLDGALHHAHCLAFLYMEGVWPESNIKHKDGHTVSLAWDNLYIPARRNAQDYQALQAQQWLQDTRQRYAQELLSLHAFRAELSDKHLLDEISDAQFKDYWPPDPPTRPPTTTHTDAEPTTTTDAEPTDADFPPLSTDEPS